MDVSRLGAAVTKFHPTADGETFSYRLEISYGSSSWIIFKRYSEFHNLHTQLGSIGIQSLPHLPSKTFSRPNEPEHGELRRKKLHCYLVNLLIRPEIRTSIPLITFLELEERTNVPVTSLKLSFESAIDSDIKMSVSGGVHLLDRGVILQAFEDNTALTKIGKVWTLMGPDTIGGVSVNLVDRERGSFEITSHRIFYKNLINQAKGICYSPISRHVIVALSTGFVDIYGFSSSDNSQLVHLSTLELHISAPVLQLQSDDQYLASIGGDNSVRIMSVTPGTPTTDVQYNVISGGRISKPLDENETITTLSLYMAGLLFLVGTSNGKILIYSASTHPPTFVTTVDTREVLRLTESVKIVVVGEEPNVPTKPAQHIVSLPINVMKINTLPDDTPVIFTGIESVILALKLGSCVEYSAEIGAMSAFKFRLNCPFEPEWNVGALHYWNEYSLLFAAYYHTIAIWDVQRLHLTQCIETTRWGKIRSLNILRFAPTTRDGRSGTEDELQSVFLAAATSSCGLQLASLHQASKWHVWEGGKDEINQKVAAGWTSKRGPWVAGKVNLPGEDQNEEDLIFGSARKRKHHQPPKPETESIDSLLEVFGSAVY